ncbi:MAG: hypothetical protein WBB23_16700 [Desulforhopalus sp.]
MIKKAEKTSAISKIIFLPKTAIGLLTSAAFLLCLIFLTGCGYTLIAPASPSNPTQVFLLDHGRHSSLVLPADCEMIRYSYGDWHWYVLNKRGFQAAFRALLLSSSAALGRQKISSAPLEESVRLAVQVNIENIISVMVERDRVDFLNTRLEHIFAENRQHIHHNPTYGVDFVPHPVPYSLYHNSNKVVAQWLRELGVEVRGGGPFSRWKLSDDP